MVGMRKLPILLCLAGLFSYDLGSAFHIGHHAPARLLLRPSSALSPKPPATVTRRTQTPIQMASGIDTLPLAMQSAIFLGTMSGVTAGGLVLAGPVLDGAEKLLGKDTFNAWSKTFSLLGVVFCAAGSAHFTSAEAFNSIYPPPGTWGLWALPGSSEFHVAWTGVAELLGGAGLLIGSLSELAPESVRPNLRTLRKVSAGALFLLTICVSPANIYMWTHNIPLKGLGPPGDIPVTAHYVRGAFQVLLLGLLGRISSQKDADAPALKQE